MKLILVMVSSLDGRTTHDQHVDNHLWTSVEDQEHFKKVIENAPLVIMGSNTYEPAKNSMIHKEGRKRIVLTHNPSKYEHEKITGQLEFTNEDPIDLLKRLEKEGYKQGYLVGGSKTNTDFFKKNLVNEIWETLEPRILGKGNGIVSDEKMDIHLSLLTCEKMNNNGTLLLKYSVIPAESL